MAWPALPGNRVVYEKDGTTIVSWATHTNPATWNVTQMASVNGHGGSLGFNMSTGGSTVYIGIAFPEVRDFKGIFIASAGENTAGTWTVYTSADTTNGLDGTWASQGTMSNYSPGAVQSVYRSNIAPFNVAGVRGVRLVGSVGGYTFQQGPTCYALHVYANLLASTVSHRVQLWHPTLDQPLAANDLNWEDTPRGSSADKTFRLKNCSATLTANDILLQMYNTSTATSSPDPATTHLLSANGTTFTATVDAGDLAPGAMSQVYTVRRVIPDSYAVGPWQPVVWPDVSTWS